MSEGQAWLERALAADERGPTAARAEALVGLNMLLWWTEGGFHRAEQLLVEATALAQPTPSADHANDERPRESITLGIRL
jgi:hypothetical protein